MSEFNKISKEEELQREIVILRFNYKDLQQENADLRAKLESKYEELENDVVARMIYSKDETENKFIQRAVKAEQERDNLQAANGVLRDTIKVVREDIIYHNQVRFAGGEVFNLINPETAGKIEKVFHLTPEQAGERVQGLVDALEAVKNECLKENLCKYYCWFHLQEMVDNALAKYRGCGK